MPSKQKSRCNRIAYLLQRSEDLEALYDLEEKISAGIRLTVKEVFMSQYLRSAYQSEHEEIGRELHIGTLSRNDLISHVLRYSYLDGAKGSWACNCPACSRREGNLI